MRVHLSGVVNELRDEGGIEMNRIAMLAVALGLLGVIGALTAQAPEEPPDAACWGFVGPLDAGSVSYGAYSSIKIYLFLQENRCTGELRVVRGTPGKAYGDPHEWTVRDVR